MTLRAGIDELFASAMRGRRAYASYLSLILCLLSLAHRPRAVAQAVPRALPSLLATPRFLRSEQRTLSVLGALGYGVREKLYPRDGLHHSAHAALSVAALAAWGLGGELRLDGRFDKHRASKSESDDGTTSAGELRGFVRYSAPIASRAHLGAEVGVWVPGAKAPSLRLDATTVDALLGVDVRARGSLSLVIASGFRFDRSSEAVASPRRLARGDVVALGMSDANAVLARIGAIAPMGDAQLFTEWSWDVLVGGHAPGIEQSPMHVAVGGHVPLSGRLRLTAALRVLLSKRPNVEAGGPLLPFPARGDLWFGLTYSHQAARPAGTGEHTRAELSQPEAATMEPAALSADSKAVPTAAPLVAEPPPPVQGQVRLLVRDHRSGQALRAQIRVLGVDQPEAQAILETVSEQGRLELTLPAGRYTVQITLRGYRKQIKKIEVEDESVTMLDVALHARSHR